MFKRVLLAATAAAGLLSFASAANADQKIGLLTCQSDGAVGLVVTSKKDYLCVFTPASGRHVSEPYVGSLRTVGVDLGITGRQDFSWAVYAPSFSGAPASLAGSYYGASVDASIASGGGAKVLVGGARDAFTLQPIGLQAQFGLNATAGLSRFELAAADSGKAVYKN